MGYSEKIRATGAIASANFSNLAKNIEFIETHPDEVIVIYDKKDNTKYPTLKCHIGVVDKILETQLLPVGEILLPIVDGNIYTPSMKLGAHQGYTYYAEAHLGGGRIYADANAIGDLCVPVAFSLQKHKTLNISSLKDVEHSIDVTLVDPLALVRHDTIVTDVEDGLRSILHESKYSRPEEVRHIVNAWVEKISFKP